MPLITRNVFIDTEFFVKANLDFNSRTIKIFEELCKRDEFNHVTTTIVVKEVKRKITEQIRDALKGITNFRRKAAVLKEHDDENIKNLFNEINESEVQEKALIAFCDFIENSKTTVLDMSKVDIDEVINMHFDEVSPFSKKKPNEFRDAFTLLAIREFLKGGDKIYVISEDPDLKDFCEENNKFVIVESLSTLLDSYNKHNEISELIYGYLNRKNDDIINMLKEDLESADAYNVSVWEDAEIDSFEVLSIDVGNPKIIHLDDESCEATLDITVKFDVDANGPDTTTGIYDKEDRVLHTFESTSNQVEEEKDFSVELELTFEIDGGEIINDDLRLYIKGLSGGIEFGVEEHTWEDYR